MTDTKKETLRSAILENIKETEKGIAETELLVTPIAPDCSLGRLTRMDAIGRKAINEESLRIAKITLVNLKRGLGMVDNENYGQCKKCGKAIPFERLLLMPAGEICMICIKKMNGKS